MQQQSPHTMFKGITQLFNKELPIFKTSNMKKENNTLTTQYENLIDSLRHAYDTIPVKDKHTVKKDSNTPWLTRLATQ
jgi:hypothetical protein